MPRAITKGVKKNKIKGNKNHIVNFEAYSYLVNTIVLSYMKSEKFIINEFSKNQRHSFFTKDKFSS